MKVYKTKKSAQIAMYILSPILILFFGGVALLSPFILEDFTWTTYLIYGPISLMFASLFTVALVDTINARIFVNDTNIRLKSVLFNRIIPVSEIEGFYITQNWIKIIPKNSLYKKIRFGTTIENDFYDWLYSNYQNLDDREKENNKEDFVKAEFSGILNDANIELTKSKKKASVLNWIGGISFALTLFPFVLGLKYALIIGMIVPAIIFVVAINDKQIRILEIKNDIFPNVSFALMMPILGIALKALYLNILDHTKIWIIIIPISFIVLIVQISLIKEIKLSKPKSYGYILGVALLNLAYSYSILVITNVYYDKSQPKAEDRVILNKRMSGSKSTSYYLTIENWEGHKEKDVKVSKQTFKDAKVGDEVILYIKQGKFNIPWYHVYLMK